MAASGLPAVPPTLKAILPYMKVASEHDQRDPVIAYWLRLYAIQAALKIDKKSKESIAFLTAVMEWLEKEKGARRDNEAITNEVVAQAHIENYALKLFMWADSEDRAARFNKNVVKAFFTAGIIYDILTTFGELSEEVLHHRKYAKWKATYIHNCLKNGEVPIPGPMRGENDEENDQDFFSPSAGGPSTSFPTYSDEPGAAPSNEPPHSAPIRPPSASQPTSLNFDHLAPGAHAPPSTPSGSHQASPSSATSYIQPPTSIIGNSLAPEDLQKAQKYCKWASSALQYEDVPTAIDNLQKALLLLTTGEEQNAL